MVGFRQLGEADRQVDVGTGVVDPPFAAARIAPKAVAKLDAAELKATVEVLWFGEARVAKLRLSSRSCASTCAVDGEGDEPQQNEHYRASNEPLVDHDSIFSLSWLPRFAGTGRRRQGRIEAGTEASESEMNRGKGMAPAP